MKVVTDMTTSISGLANGSEEAWLAWKRDLAERPSILFQKIEMQ